MFNVGGGELIVIMLLALIVLGPQRLPSAARQVGKVLGDLRRLSTGFQNEVRSAFEDVDDPDQLEARRNVLAKESRVADAPRPDGAEVRAPGDDDAAPSVDAPADRPVRRAPLRAATPEAPEAVANGTPVKAARRSVVRKATGPEQPAARKAAAKRAAGSRATAKKAPSKAATERPPA